MISALRRTELIEFHAHPQWGTPYWINLCKNMPHSLPEIAECPSLLPKMDVHAMRTYPLEYFVSQKALKENSYLITGETSGFSGHPITTVFSSTEFIEGFISPFLTRAQEVRFPVNGRWLWIGPSGPHIIGKAVREIIKQVGGIDPFSIDFDPRWYKKMVSGSLAQERYMKHVEEQAMRLIRLQSIDVLFSTPPVIARLAEIMTDHERANIRGVHYGGVAMTSEQYRTFHQAFPQAVHLSGYGNSLFGVSLECGWDENGIEYATQSSRIETQVVHVAHDTIRECACGEKGTIMMSRYDETVLIINMMERDTAIKTEKGIVDPHPHETMRAVNVLY